MPEVPTPKSNTPTTPDIPKTPPTVPLHKDSFFRRHLLAELLATLLFAATVGVVFYIFSSVPVVNLNPVQHKPAIDTSTWKIYANAQYGYQLKYPSDWHEFDSTQGASYADDEQNIVMEDDMRAGEAEIGLQISVLKSSYPLTIPSTDTNINGYPAKYDASLNYYVLQHNNRYVQIKEYSDNNKPSVTDAILSTFKFTDRITSVNSSWKKYQNIKYNYSFEYPTKWDLVPCDEDTVLIFGRCASEGTPTVSVNVIPNWSLDTFYNQHPDLTDPHSITIAGIQADEFESVAPPMDVPEPGPTPGTKLTAIVFQHGPDVIDIGLAQEPDANLTSDFNHIISTFKFLSD
ncbi:MAG TPA: hypothetical protein VFX17_01075 [Patescibacteria group bacterium]|nr:hypothetical protein [Patescibacteria group bacterium]